MLTRIVGVSVHGESDEMSDERCNETIDEWKPIFFKIIRDHNVPAERACDRDQTGLFYAKLPNRMHLKKENATFLYLL